MTERAGQFGVVHSTGWYANLTRFFQSFREPPELAAFTHTFVAIDEEHILEAMPGGVRISPADEYPNIVWSRQALTAAQRLAIIGFSIAQLGKPYAWEDVPLIAIALATGEHTPAWLDGKLADDQRWICSELVDAAYNHAGKHLFRNIPAAAVYPAMLARLALGG